MSLGTLQQDGLEFYRDAQGSKSVKAETVGPHFHHFYWSKSAMRPAQTEGEGNELQPRREEQYACTGMGGIV